MIGSVLVLNLLFPSIFHFSEDYKFYQLLYNLLNTSLKTTLEVALAGKSSLLLIAKVIDDGEPTLDTAT